MPTRAPTAPKAHTRMPSAPMCDCPAMQAKKLSPGNTALGVLRAAGKSVRVMPATMWSTVCALCAPRIRTVQSPRMTQPLVLRVPRSLRRRWVVCR